MFNKDPSRIVLNQQSKLAHVMPNNQSAQLPTSAVQQVPPMASNQVVPTMALNQAPSTVPSQVLPTEVPLTTSNQESPVAPNQVDDRLPMEVSALSSGHVNTASASDLEPITVSNPSFSASTHASANSSDQVRLNESDHVSLNVSDQVFHNTLVPPNASVSATATLPPTTASPSMSDLRVTQAPSVTSNQVSLSTSDKEDSSPAAHSAQLNSDNERPEVSLEKDSHHRRHFSIAQRISRALKAILLAALVVVAVGYPNISSECLSNLKQALDRFLPLLTQPTAVVYGPQTAQFLEPTVALPTQPAVIVHDPEKAGLLELAGLAPDRYMEELHLRATGITQATACTHVPLPTGSPAISIVVCTVTETVTVTATQSVTITTDLEKPTVLTGSAPLPKLTSPETVNSGSSTYYIFYCSILLCLFSFRFQILRLLPYINKLYHYMCRLLRYAYRLLHYMFCLFAELTSPAENNETSPGKALESDVMTVEGDLEAEKMDEELEIVNIKEDPDPKV